jgi:hypothetical protein
MSACLLLNSLAVTEFSGKGDVISPINSPFDCRLAMVPIPKVQEPDLAIWKLIYELK